MRRRPRAIVPIEVTRTGSSHDRNSGIGCNALEVRIGNVTHELPTLCASHADYEAGRASGVRTRAGLFNYHHVSRGSASLTSRATRDGITRRIRRIQGRHGPTTTAITVAHAGGLPIAGLRAHHALQDSLPVDIISGADDPGWTFEQFKGAWKSLIALTRARKRHPRCTYAVR